MYEVVMDKGELYNTIKDYNTQIHLKACALLDLIKDEYDYCVLCRCCKCNECIMGNRHCYERYVK